MAYWISLFYYLYLCVCVLGFAKSFSSFKWLASRVPWSFFWKTCTITWCMSADQSYLGGLLPWPLYHKSRWAGSALRGRTSRIAHRCCVDGTSGPCVPLWCRTACTHCPPVLLLGDDRWGQLLPRRQGCLWTKEECERQSLSERDVTMTDKGHDHWWNYLDWLSPHFPHGGWCDSGAKPLLALHTLLQISTEFLYSKLFDALPLTFQSASFGLHVYVMKHQCTKMEVKLTLVWLWASKTEWYNIKKFSCPRYFLVNWHIKTSI